jgi:hypothetical protein
VVRCEASVASTARPIAPPTSGDKRKPLDSARLLSEVHDGRLQHFFNGNQQHIWGKHSVRRLTMALAMAALVAMTPEAAIAKGGSGKVSTYGVGPLRLNVSGPNAARRFAGKPDHVSFENLMGLPSVPAHAAWEDWTYHFPAHGYVDISFWWSGHAWLFEQFDTNLQRFHTARGTGVGMTYGQAAARERVPWSGGCTDSGFWHYRRHYSYAYVVGVSAGQRVRALHATGPHPPLC